MMNYDLIIVGGGMVGLALAAELKHSDLKIALIDPKPVQMEFEQDSYDMRVSAITRASEDILRRTGAWNCIRETEKSEYKKMLVWDGESAKGQIEFDCATLGQENIGHIIENRILRKALYQSIINVPNIECLFGEQCRQVSYRDNEAELILESGKSLLAKLLVAADGAFSWLRSHSNIKMNENSYRQKAIVATVKSEKSHNKTAYQRFDQLGPLAFLPLRDKNHCSIVWSQDDCSAEELSKLNDEEFLEQLELRFERKLGKLKLESKRLSFPLSEKTAESTIKHRLALIGDAAHTIHPLAGQGVNLGFADAKILAETIAINRKKNKDIGLKENLRPYERQRASDSYVMKKAMLTFKQLFGSNRPIIQMIRSWGMEAFNKNQLIKSIMIKKALGLD